MRACVRAGDAFDAKITGMKTGYESFGVRLAGVIISGVPKEHFNETVRGCPHADLAVILSIHVNLVACET